MIIDAHHHFWHYSEEEYGWISDEMKALRRDFLPLELQSELFKNGVSGVVSVQARQSLEETEWLLKMAAGNDFIKGVVGWVDLCSPDADAQLKKFSANKKLVGVRHVVQGEPDDRFMLRPDFLNGIGLLAKYNLTYDILIFPKHLSVAAEMVAKFPDQKFVLDHIAKPFIRDRKMDPWKADVSKLASGKNVYCKISGMVTEADWNNWTPETFYPYMDVIVEAFGYDRIMLGTDWPVCLVAGTYADVINIPLQYFKSLPEKDLQKMAALNCKTFYSL